jgi:4-amino-4-deoxy-L-arabinose transferase-like glycosyltransferase
VQRRLTFVAIVFATLIVRLPFLLRADRFFDADEAVEGLMARHLGDHSLFLWGQRYKGTPEVFVTGAVFHVAGPGVIALKAVTLACFVVFVCLNFRLLERLWSRRLAWIATAFFIVGPPSLVLWTLSGSAEIVTTWIAGVALMFAAGCWYRTRSPLALFAAFAAIGAGLWIQQYILYYVVPITLVITAAEWQTLRRVRLPAWLHVVLALVAAVVLLYIVLGFAAFFTSGLDVPIAGVRMTATHPQKMWWIAGAVFAAGVGLVAVFVFRVQLIAPALGFLAGYAPAIIGRIGNHGYGAPISRLDFAGLRQAMPDITGVMLPMVLGFRDPTTAARTVFIPLVLVLAAVGAWSYWTAYHRRLMPVFHLLPIVAVIMFFVSGSYIDAQSYRYLMPIYGALPIIYAVGVDAAWGASRSAGVALLIFMVGLFASQQLGWYQHLNPDPAREQTIACLDAKGIHAARAPYWQSYPMTFLTGERIIVSPIDGVDRYKPYSDITGDAPTVHDLCPRPEPRVASP